MKKLLGIVALFLLAYIIIKMGGKELEVKTEKEFDTKTETQTNFVSQDIDTRVFFYEGKLIDSNMLIIKETTKLDNEDFELFKDSFDFEHNTYLIINCQNKDVSEVVTEDISRNSISFKMISENKENFDNSVLIEIQNLKITNLNLITINWEEN